MLEFGQIFADLPDASGQERFETLAAAEGARVERIVSRGQASPTGFWYDQAWDEWVLLLQGSARFRFEDEPVPRDLGPGDYLWIRAHRRHRVEATAPAVDTVWLAVHFPHRSGASS